MSRLRTLTTGGGGVTLGALALCVVGCLPSAQTPRTLGSYLFAWLFFLGLSLGSLAALMMHHLTGGGWSAAVHRYFLSALAPLPWLALLFVPIAVACFHAFPWSAGVSAAGPAHFRSLYLRGVPFVVRGAAALAIWCVLARLLRNCDRTPATTSVAGLIVYPLTMTWAAVDWVGSLEPRWSSTALGLTVIVAQVLAAFAFAIVCATRRKLREDALTATHCGDLGNLLLTFVMTWMYLAFVQFLIIWAEDLPRETVWYQPRLAGSWRIVSLAIVIAQFALPFALLLFRRLKRQPGTLGGIALLVLVANWLYVGWLILPSLAPTGPSLSWTDLAATVAIGALWLGVFRADLSRPLPARRTAVATGAGAAGAEGAGVEGSHGR